MPEYAPINVDPFESWYECLTGRTVGRSVNRVTLPHGSYQIRLPRLVALSLRMIDYS